MAQKKKTTRELEAAFREVGIDRVQACDDQLRVWLDDDQPGIDILPVSVGHGRPQELRNALAHLKWEAAAPCLTATFIANHFTTGALEILQNEGANYLDDTKFVFRHKKPYVVIQQDRPRVAPQTLVRTAGLGGMAGVAVQQMILDERNWWQVTDLAEKAQVAAGTAQTALSRLEHMGLVDVEGSGPRKRRRLRDRTGALDRWVESARHDRRTLVTAFVNAQGPLDLARHVSHALEEKAVPHAVTGACAALLVAPHVTDVRRCEVWVDPAVGTAAVLDALGTGPAEKGGNVTILQARNDAPLFLRHEVGGVQIANPLRLYADLLDDPRRGEEQAEFLRETVLKL
jgi:hypothetical protein